MEKIVMKFEINIAKRPFVMKAEIITKTDG